MSFSYPLDLPANMIARGAVIDQVNAVGVSESPFSFNKQAVQWGGEKWRIEYNLPPYATRAEIGAWLAFATRLRGNYGTFLTGVPGGSTARGIASGTPQIDGAGQTGYDILTKGWTPNITGILLEGDYIQFGSGSSSRLHIVTADANSDGSGNATVEVWPAVISTSAPSDSSTIVTSNAKGVFRMASREISHSVDENQHYRFGWIAESEV